MNIKHAICLTTAVFALSACKDEDKKTDANKIVKEVTKKVKEAEKSGGNLYFVCRMSNDQLSYLSVMEKGPKGATNESMAKSFEAEVKSLDRTYYPLPEGMVTTCESGTSIVEMSQRALSLHEEMTTAFRTVTSWKPLEK